MYNLRACLHGRGTPHIGEVTFGGSPHLSCKHDHIKMMRLHEQAGYLTYLGSPTSMHTYSTISWARVPGQTIIDKL